LIHNIHIVRGAQYIDIVSVFIYGGRKADLFIQVNRVILIDADRITEQKGERVR